MLDSIKALGLDFDGVVLDSTLECMITSWNAWQDLVGASSLRWSVADFSQQEINDFSYYRPFVRGSRDFLVLRSLLSERSNRIDESCFIRTAEASKNSEEALRFQALFFQRREELRERDFNSWVEMHTAYDSVIRFMRRFQKRGQLTIVSLKDEKSIISLTEALGLPIKKNDVMVASDSTGKLRALQAIAEKSGLGNEQVGLIDDNLNHLLEPQAAGFGVFQAAWGMVPIDTLVRADRLGIPRITLAELERHETKPNASYEGE